MLSSSPSKIHEPLITGVSPATHDRRPTPGKLRNTSTSCDLLIFVEDAAEAVVSLDLVDLGWRAVGEWS